ncbi:MAG: Transcriptional regulator [Pseudonocardiales bacterium]|jgi:AcrR family transcriptional regulator|nr:Transcriptional regulator [Pseudonocardiales bacterium]
MTAIGKTARTQRAVERACHEGAKLFSEKGYSETTTRELAAAMDVTNGTFYYYFPSKEDLLRQICEDALAEITAAVTKAVDGAESGLDAVTQMIHSHVRTIVESRHSHTTMLTELRALNGEHRVTIVAARDRYESLVREILASAKADGSLKTSIELAPLTLLLLNLLNWTIFWYRPNMGLTGDEIADRMVTLFLNGAVNPA